MNKLKFVCVYRTSTLKLINWACMEKSGQEQLKIETLKVATQIKEMGAQLSRQKINTSNGSWFCAPQPLQDMMFMVLAVQAYPERHAYALTAQIEQDLAKLGGDVATHNDKVIRGACNLKDLAQRYNNLQELDKVHQAQAQVDESSIVMQENIKNMLVNQHNLDTLGNKADKLNMNAKSFNKNSGDIASILYWRNMKIKILITLVVLIALAIILIPIILKYK